MSAKKIQQTTEETANPENFQFRNLHPKILFGTVSDRYASWIGQIYTAERYKERVKDRANKVAGQSFRHAV